jgi:hypothetical protein
MDILIVIGIGAYVLAIVNWLIKSLNIISIILFAVGTAALLPPLLGVLSILYSSWHNYSLKQKKEQQVIKARPLLSSAEKIVKSYRCTKMISPRCDGYLTITNRRVIFHGDAAGSRIVQELKVDNVAGISTFYGKAYHFPVIAIAVAMLAYAIYKFFWASKYNISFSIIGMVLFAAVLLYRFSSHATFVLKIYSSQATSAPIALGEGYGTPFGNRAIQALTGCPTAETDTMMKELGMLIQDIQTYHDKVFDIWQGR